MPDIEIRYGSVRHNGPEHYFRVRVSFDGGSSYDDVLVMKRDDRDGPDKDDQLYRVEWAASDELERETEAVLSRMELRRSAKHTKNELTKFLEGVPREYVPPDTEVPLDLAVLLANSPIKLGVHAGKEPEPWEQELDAAALRRAGIVQMPELFRWIPWFAELAEMVREGRREGLVARAKKVDWAGLKPAVLAEGEVNADPLTFFYHLAAVAGGRAEKREKVYSSVAEVFEMESDLDYSFDEGFIFPTPPGIVVRFNNSGADPRLLWEMFDQACAVDSTSYGSVSADTFGKMLRIKGVGVPKLTQVLFLINPRAFQPFDDKALLGLFRNTPAEITWDEYLAEMKRIRTVFPGCQPYELNIIGYLWASGRFPRKGNGWYQIGAREDEWRDFRDNNRIHDSGQGDRPGPAESDGLAAPKQDYPLHEPNPGDVVLVRSGTSKGRGIGIVYRNDYGEQSHRSGPIHVLWVNKEQAPLAANMPAVRFSRVGRGAYDAFAKSNAYSETLRMLEPPHGPNDPPPIRHALNTILYGPPGTGKTWHTVARAVAIVEGHEVSEVAQEDRATVKDRFEQHRRAGRIEMVTFHQNTTYEDFVEGIRPVLDSGEVQYEMSLGVFRRIAERAAANPDERYVLIIDEINRGNIARIFGELITLIEDSKRIGRHDEARVTLPGSKADFGVPAKLHVLGTMNTADRSIALLDTALRRRFVFEEMMPDPDHSGIATDIDGIDCGRLLKAMNRRIAALLDREHQIGHTYLLRVDTVAALAATFRNRIMPLLQEYFYDDWEKIAAVLNDNGFVGTAKPPMDLVNRGLVNSGRNVYDMAPSDHAGWTDAAAYRKVYEMPSAGTDDEAETY